MHLGSGKSSVVLAGLVPKLQKQGNWLFTHFRPGSDPFQKLAEALVPLYAPDLDNNTDRIAQTRKLANYLDKGEVILTDVIADIQHNYPHHRVLLIADQFEELYTLCGDEKTRQHFLDCLLTIIQSPKSVSDSVVVTTMRADFLENALSYRPFVDVLQNDIKLGSMNREELKEVIEKPAQKLRVIFQDGLVERILEDVEQQPGSLPLLRLLSAGRRAGPVRSTAGGSPGDGLGLPRGLSGHGRQTLEQGSPPGLRLVHRAQRPQPPDLRPDDRRLSRRPASRPPERESRRGIDPGLSPGPAGAAPGREYAVIRGDTISMNNHHPELFRRHRLNPILTAADWPYPVNSVFNPGATLLPDGTTLLLCRVEDRRGQSHLCAARSANGDGRLADRSPAHPVGRSRSTSRRKCGASKIRASPSSRIEQVRRRLYRLHAGGSGRGPGAHRRFPHFERYGVIMPPEDKDAALLPRRIGGQWALIHRPVSSPRAHMWMSYSPDLRHWGSHKLMLEARRGGWWDANKIGLSSPPIETPAGLADDLPWRATDRGRLDLSAGARAVRSEHAGALPQAQRRVVLRPGSGLRTARGRRQRRLPLRLHHRSRRRHHQTCITARRIRASPWPPAAFAPFWSGWDDERAIRASQ